MEFATWHAMKFDGLDYTDRNGLASTGRVNDGTAWNGQNGM